MEPPLESVHRPPDGPDAIGDLRRDLRGLVALESLELATGIGALLMIAIRAILVAENLVVAISIAAIVLLALSFLLLALRIRAGQALVRHELWAMESRQKLDEATRRVAQRSLPYRSSAVVPCRCGFAPAHERYQSRNAT
jgi:hypothetical protein